MMTATFFTSLISNLTPAFLTLLLLAGVGLLIKGAISQDAIISQQRAALVKMRAHLAQTVKAQVELSDQVDVLRRRCAKVVAHQQLAKASPDTKRFDLAVRMLKRGAGDQDSLQELGLSKSEATLLWRLHGADTNHDPRALARSAAGTDAQTVRDRGTALRSQERPEIDKMIPDTGITSADSDRGYESGISGESDSRSDRCVSNDSGDVSTSEAVSAAEIAGQSRGIGSAYVSSEELAFDTAGEPSLVSTPGAPDGQSQGQALAAALRA